MQFEEMARWQAEQGEAVERLFRGVLAGDGGTVNGCLAWLHPGEGREVALVLCAVMLRDVLGFHRAMASSGDAPPGSHGGTASYIVALASQFSAAEVDSLARCFAPLEQLLTAPGGAVAHVRGFLGPPTRYVYDELTPDAQQALAPGCLEGLVDRLSNVPARL